MNAGQPAWSGLGPGSAVAGYRIEARIGRGGMATVFRAHDERLGRTVALKILAPALADDEEFRNRFIRESRAAAVTDHPHIIPVFEAGEANGVLFIAMRFVRGGDLRSRLSQFGSLPPDAVADIVSQTASALDAAHKHGLVHRDVKPGNILLDVGEETGRPDHVYLSDFGLSKVSLAVGTLAALTSAGQVLGTLDYMAPEQIAGGPLDGRADQYGLACTAYELLCGTPPFGKYPSTALMRAHRSDTPPPISSRGTDLPAGTDAIFAKALAKAPAARYGSCTDFAGSLRVVFGVGPYRSGQHVAPAPIQPGPQAPSPASPAPRMPQVKAAYPSTAPTIVRRPEPVVKVPPIYAEPTELAESEPSPPTPEQQAPVRARRRWFAWPGRRGHAGTGNGPNGLPAR